MLASSFFPVNQRVFFIILETLKIHSIVDIKHIYHMFSKNTKGSKLRVSRFFIMEIEKQYPNKKTRL